MAVESQSDELPRVLVLSPPTVFTSLESQFRNRFHFLKPWNSKLPLLQFLISNAQSVRACLVIPGDRLAVSSAILDCLPSLKLVVTASAGVDHLHVAELRRRRVAIAYAGNLFTQDVADMAVGLLIDVLRNVSAGDRFVRQGLWPTQGDFPLGIKGHLCFSSNCKFLFRFLLSNKLGHRLGVIKSQLSGKRIGIVGLGKIGSEVAKRLEGFGCRISYNSKTKKPLVLYSYHSNVQELATNCDALVICCQLTEETHHLINRDVLVAMGKDGVIINVGRGAIIDEKAMIECLIQGEISVAGLDVFEDEPEIPQQLFNLDNVVLSPHVAITTTESMVGLTELAVENLEAFFSNKPLVSPFLD